MAPVATVVRSSHERWDGGGYPDALAGADIPLAARIVSICDAYEAMTSVRPYRKPISKSEALDELRRCAGSQFDPTLVELFCAVESDEVRPAGEPVPGPA
jgi:two-component system, cell cycle response regulator